MMLLLAFGAALRFSSFAGQGAASDQVGIVPSFPFPGAPGTSAATGSFL